MQSSHLCRNLLLASLIFGSLAVCPAATIVLPTNCPVDTDPGQGGGPCATTSGGNNQAASVANARFQQAMSSSLFSALNPGGWGIQITGLGLRPDITNTIPSTTGGLTISMGLTTLSPESLGSNMNNNFNSGPKVLVYSNSSANFDMNPLGPGQTVHDFDYFTTLTTPFTYNPAGGKSLLFDVLIGAQAPGVLIDTTGQVAGDGVGIQSGFGNIGILTSAQKTGGFVVQFQYNVLTPEPGSFVMLGTGLLGAAILLRRRSRQKPE